MIRSDLYISVLVDKEDYPDAYGEILKEVQRIKQYLWETKTATRPAFFIRTDDYRLAGQAENMLADFDSLIDAWLSE